jgi:hypothetical protein
MTVRRRRSSSVPRFSSSRRTRLTVARDVPVLGEFLLGERDLGGTPAVAVQLCELAQPPAEPLLGGKVERLEQPLVEPPHLPGQQAHQHVVDSGMAAPERLELRMGHRIRLGLLERRDRRGPPVPLCEEGQLAEMVARSADTDHRGVAERRHDPDREPALDDQVQRVARIVAMKDDLVADELPAARHRE